MHLLRARIKKDIICEFLPPVRSSHRVIILADGMPSVPSKKSIAEFWSKKNFWVFHPRYRGTWESAGTFLARSPHEDLLDVIHALFGEIRSLYDGTKFNIKPREIYIFGASFGGAAALLASRDKRVTKVVVFSPVVDWTAPAKTEPLAWLENFVHEAFGMAYRFSHSHWRKLSSGEFFNPQFCVKDTDGKKILIFHARDDDVVNRHSVEKFAKRTCATSKLYKRGGHFSLSESAKPLFYKHIRAFLKK